MLIPFRELGSPGIRTLFVNEVVVQPVMAGESSKLPFTKLACTPWLARSAPPSTNVPARSTVPQVRVSAPHDRFMTFLTAILVVMVLAHRVFNAEGYACAQPPHDRDTEIRHTSQKAPWRTRHQLLHGRIGVLTA